MTLYDLRVEIDIGEKKWRRNVIVLDPYVWAMVNFDIDFTSMCSFMRKDGLSGKFFVTPSRKWITCSFGRIRLLGFRRWEPNTFGYTMLRQKVISAAMNPPWTFVSTSAQE